MDELIASILRIGPIIIIIARMAIIVVPWSLIIILISRSARSRGLIKNLRWHRTLLPLESSMSLCRRCTHFSVARDIRPLSREKNGSCPTGQLSPSVRRSILCLETCPVSGRPPIQAETKASPSTGCWRRIAPFLWLLSCPAYPQAQDRFLFDRSLEFAAQLRAIDRVSSMEHSAVHGDVATINRVMCPLFVIVELISL